MIRGFALLALAGCVIAPTTTFAQGPWTVELAPSMSPLPIGFCAAVQLKLFDPSSRDVPRNPLGQRVTMADFDIDVTSPDGTSVAANKIDATHVSACGCRGARPGTEATITATYPARALADNARVPGVEFRNAATFVLSEAKGDTNPAACQRLATAPAPQPLPMPLPNQPASGARTKGPAAAGSPGARAPLTITVPALSLIGTTSHRSIRTFTVPPLSLNGPAPVLSVRTFTLPQLILHGK